MIQLPEQTENFRLYKKALSQIEKDQWDDAIISMESFVHQSPQSELADNAIFWIAQCYLEKNEVDLARAELQRLLALYPKSDRSQQADSLLKTLRPHFLVSDNKEERP